MESQKDVLKVELLSPWAKEPVRVSPGAAGYDLVAAHDVNIAPNKRALVKTDLAFSFPPGLYARIAPRSGLALKKGIDVFAGVVDQDYRGNVGVVLANFDNEPFQVERGDRIAQVIFERIATPRVEVVAAIEGTTARGDGGFGSTGNI